MNQLEQVRAEAVKILRIVNRIRKAEAEAARERGEPRFKAISASELLAGPIPIQGEPRLGDKVSDAFEDGLHFWALRVAPLVTFAEWEAMVWDAKDQVPDFDGDAIRFFENRFEGMALKCGSKIWP